MISSSEKTEIEDFAFGNKEHTFSPNDINVIKGKIDGAIYGMNKRESNPTPEMIMRIKFLISLYDVEKLVNNNFEDKGLVDFVQSRYNKDIDLNNLL